MTHNSPRPRASACWFASALAMGVAALPSPAAAEEPESSDGKLRLAGNVGLGVGAARIDEDWFIVTTPTAELSIPDLTLTRSSPLFNEPQTADLRFHLEVPLQFRVKDNPPEQEGTFRKESWDEPAEFLRILRFVEFGAPYDGIYFRLGELPNVRIGHGTVVDAYNNTIELDHGKWGLHTNLNTVFGGQELMIDDLAGPGLVSWRAYVRPIAIVLPESWGKRFAVGTSISGDFRAPAALNTDLEGRYVIRDGNFGVLARDPTGVWGLDLELAAVTLDRVKVTPYTDVNHHLGSGTGWHLGTFAGFGLTDTIWLNSRIEYRLLGDGYLPSYFSAFYDAEKYSYLTVGDSVTRYPKLQYLRSVDLGMRHGYAAELGLNIDNKIIVNGGWENAQGPDNSAMFMELRIPALSILQFGAYYANRHFDGPKEIFDLENALALVETRLTVYKPLYIEGKLQRRWRLGRDGEYQPVDDFAFGVGVAFGF